MNLAISSQLSVVSQRYEKDSMQLAVGSKKTVGRRQNAAKSKKERDDWKISKFEIANSNWLHPDLRSLVLGLRSFVTGQLVRAVCS